MDQKTLQDHINILKKEVIWLEKEREKQIKKVEKRIYSKNKGVKEGRMVMTRYLFAGLISLVVIGGLLNLFNYLTLESSPLWYIIIALFGGLFFGKIIHKLRGDDISDEASRVTKEKAKDPQTQKKNMSKDELERQKIIELQIIERKKAIEDTISSKRIVDARYRLDLPDIIVDK